MTWCAAAWVKTGSQAGRGRDILIGQDENDILYGSAGNDVLVGQDGTDVADGGRGSDTMYGGDSGDFCVDTFSSPGEVGVYLDPKLADGAAGQDRLFHFEGVIGSHYGDILEGGDRSEMFVPLGGDDQIDAGAGQDQVSFWYSPQAVQVDLRVFGPDDKPFASGEGLDVLLGIEDVTGSEVQR